jgi:hypothetical protein
VRKLSTEPAVQEVSSTPLRNQTARPVIAVVGGGGGADR